jgi:hypothetical protein
MSSRENSYFRVDFYICEWLSRDDDVGRYEIVAPKSRGEFLGESSDRLS